MGLLDARIWFKRLLCGSPAVCPQETLVASPRLSLRICKMKITTSIIKRMKVIVMKKVKSAW